IIKIILNDFRTSAINQPMDILNNIEFYLDNEHLYYQIEGTMENIFNEPVICIAHPIMINQEFLGTIYLSVPSTELIQTLDYSYRIILVFTMFAIIIAFILVYFFTKRISLPLLEINRIAKVMSDGDFKKRIYIEADDEIGELADILNNMAENLDEQETRRREFISNISHDIRSPLTSMKGFLEAIIDGTIPENKKEKYLNIVLEETERLTILANNILDMNKLEALDKRDNNSNFELNSLIRRIVISFETRALEKDLEINLIFAEENSMVYADSQKVERMIYNLVDNAIKFTENNTKIYISTELNNKSNKLFVSVKDEGMGISLEEQKRIFDRFYKSDFSRGKDKKGSGLGLSIVKEFAISMGETLELKSEPPNGSEFIFSLTKSE
ncbi:MAG: HAMP domain-containing sensor histidine kinase, partial [bacterium]